jgi:hypothetical protein
VTCCEPSNYFEVQESERTVAWNQEFRTPDTRKPKITLAIGSKGDFIVVDLIGDTILEFGVLKVEELGALHPDLRNREVRNPDKVTRLVWKSTFG